MNWNRIDIGVCDSETPQKIRKAFSELESRVELVNKKRAALDAQAAEAKAVELSPAVMGTLNEIRIGRIITWQTELDIRQKFAEWVDLYVPALRAMKEKAFAAIRDADDEIRRRLEGIGYVSMLPSQSGPGKITQGMLLAHPLHHAAVARESDLDAAINVVLSLKRRSEEARTATIGEMNRFRDSAASVA